MLVELLEQMNAQKQLEAKAKQIWIENELEDMDEIKWLINNCFNYGFILRYPENKEDITLYKFEPWHFRYVGVEVATYMYENNLCLEEYYAMFLDK